MKACRRVLRGKTLFPGAGGNISTVMRRIPVILLVCTLPASPLVIAGGGVPCTLCSQGFCPLASHRASEQSSQSEEEPSCHRPVRSKHDCAMQASCNHKVEHYLTDRVPLDLPEQRAIAPAPAVAPDTIPDLFLSDLIGFHFPPRQPPRHSVFC